MDIWTIIIFMLPAYFASMAPVFVKNVPFLNIPVDGGKKWKNIRIFGNNKTWRGLIFGTMVGTLAVFLQVLVMPNSFFLTLDAFLLGALLAFGALVGDMVESFFKRRSKIPPGKSWIPFDQIDAVVGALLFGSLIFFPGWIDVLAIILVSFILHIISNLVGYWLKLNKQWI